MSVASAGNSLLPIDSRQLLLFVVCFNAEKLSKSLQYREVQYTDCSLQEPRLGNMMDAIFPAGWAVVASCRILFVIASSSKTSKHYH